MIEKMTKPLRAHRVFRSEVELDGSASDLFALLSNPETERGLLEGWLSLRSGLPTELVKEQGFSPRLWLMGKIPLWRQHLNVVELNPEAQTLVLHSEGGPFAQWDHRIRIREVNSERKAGVPMARLIEEIEVTPKKWWLAPLVYEGAWFYLRFRHRRLRRLMKKDRGLSLKSRNSKTVTLSTLFSFWLGGLGGAVGVVTTSGCASAPKGLRQLHGVGIFDLKIRRPEGKGADPQAGPGGKDYRSETPVSDQLDCRPSNELLKDVPLQELRACLDLMKSELKDEVDVAYRLRRQAQPQLELIETKSTPPCIKGALPVIPVPREIFFQSDEEGRPECYSSRLPIEADEVLSRKMPIARTNLVLQFPLAEVPATDHELSTLIKTWILSLFFTTTDPREISAWIVPKHLCAKCFGGYDFLLKPFDPPPALWPSRSE
jgi:hypothetical protein